MELDTLDLGRLSRCDSKDGSLSKYKIISSRISLQNLSLNAPGNAAALKSGTMPALSVPKYTLKCGFVIPVSM
jgi:hypothetical protein